MLFFPFIFLNPPFSTIFICYGIHVGNYENEELFFSFIDTYTHPVGIYWYKYNLYVPAANINYDILLWNS